MSSSGNGVGEVEADGKTEEVAAVSLLDAFLADIVDLALSVDRRLAGILCGGDAPASPARRWEGGQTRGLELCLNMLRYARAEVARGEQGRRLDEAIAHAAAELDLARGAENRALH